MTTPALDHPRIKQLILKIKFIEYDQKLMAIEQVNKYDKLLEKCQQVLFFSTGFGLPIKITFYTNLIFLKIKMSKL